MAKRKISNKRTKSLTKAARQRAKWREEANKELRAISEQKDLELTAKKPWYKKVLIFLDFKVWRRRGADKKQRS